MNTTPVKLPAFILSLIFIIVGLHVFMFYQLTQQGDRHTRYTQIHGEAKSKLNQTLNQQLDQAVLLQAALRFGEQMQRTPTRSTLFKASIAQFDAGSKEIRGQIKDSLTILNRQNSRSSESNLVATLSILNTVQDKYDHYESLVIETTQLIAKGEIRLANEKAISIEKNGAEIRQRIRDALKALDSMTASTSNQNSEKEQLTLLTTLGAILLITLIVIRKLSASSSITPTPMPVLRPELATIKPLAEKDEEEKRVAEHATLNLSTQMQGDINDTLTRLSAIIDDTKLLAMNAALKSAKTDRHTRYIIDQAYELTQRTQHATLTTEKILRELSNKPSKVDSEPAGRTDLRQLSLDEVNLLLAQIRASNRAQTSKAPPSPQTVAKQAG